MAQANKKENTHLSCNAFSRIYTRDTNENENFVLQITSIIKEKRSVYLSDGTYASLVICIDVDSIAENVKVNDVLLCGLQIAQKGGNDDKGPILIPILRSFEIVKSDLQKIGNPTEIHFNHLPENFKINEEPYKIVSADNVAARSKKMAIQENNATGADDYDKINMISEGQGHSLTIKARVLSLAPIRTFKNSNGEGKLLSLILGDDSGEIEGIMFNDQVDQFKDIFEESKIYTISSFSVKPANPRYKRANHPCQISLNSKTEVTELSDEEENSEIPKIILQCQPIKDIAEVKENANVDVCGALLSEIDSQSIRTKKGDDIIKNEFEIGDESGSKVKVVTWGDLQDDIANLNIGSVLAIKGALVKSYLNMKFISITSLTKVMLGKKIPENEKVKTVKEWYEKGGANNDLNVLQDYRKITSILYSIQDIVKRCENIQQESFLYFRTEATLNFISPKRLYYNSCPRENCLKGFKKELGETTCGNGCNINEDEEPIPRYLLTLRFSDSTGNIYVNCLNQECGEKIFGKSAVELAQDVKRLSKDGEDDATGELKTYLTQFSNVKFFINIKCYRELYENRETVKKNIITMEKTTEYVRKHNGIMLANIRLYEEQLKYQS